MILARTLAVLMLILGAVIVGMAYFISSWLEASLAPPPAPEWVHTVVIVSPCQPYGLVVVYADGSVAPYRAGEPVPKELTDKFDDAPDRVTAVVVPCTVPLPGA